MAVFPMKFPTNEMLREGARFEAECERLREEALAQRVADLVVEKIVAAERRRKKLMKGLDDGR